MGYYVRFRNIAVSVVVAAFSFSSRAERILSEKEMLARCYAQLTGQRLGVKDSLWAKLPGRTGVSLCLSLLSDVQLGSDGVLTQSTNPVSRRILKQFHDFHRDWFAVHWAYDPSFPDQYGPTVDVFEASEPSMYITRALFSQTPLPYSSVLTGNTSLEAVRDSSTLSAYAKGASGLPRATKAFYVGETADPNILFNQSTITAQTALTGAAGSYVQIATPLAQIGTLIGIRPISASTQIGVLWSDNYLPSAQLSPTDLVIPQELHKNFGAGAIGSQPFLFMNLGHPYGYKATGAQKLPRRAIKEALSSFLCLTRPYSRESDVVSYLSTTAGAAPFRTAKACLRCHATMDLAASTMRNLRPSGPANINLDPAHLYRFTTMIAASKVDMPAPSVAWPDVGNPNFYRTPASGELFFRSVNGQLIHQPVADLNGLGTALAGTDDFYACAAKRYFKYFTGIDIDLFDPYDPANAPDIQAMTEQDKEYRNYILTLGQQLKTTGSLRELIQSIMQSDYYKLAGFGR